ncbi:hypothetical protein QL992_14495 [Microbacterium sp. APC 3898]|uniref:Uncharacterized protein n=2 Tax=Planococcus TaxID=1372 RepID=A0ABT7ZHH6_9BACL|nr:MULTISPECIES: hypothetical protein [Terrabacteria group]MBD8015483.1 hypothetical protein [Planococcus wigleyi]MDN3426610.1 hypothetical protein [Planococcus sp. APC 4016]MDN3437869.1 hypothetical protein [Planococcus sp. APC 3900]MDN3500426.1 hypothetical protein [Microbacterium sp. APC 3898]
MKTPTILILFIIAMQLITSANALIFDGMLGDIVFWFNSALFMGAMAVYVYRMDKEKNTAKK